jgi:PAS domain S-box-containing protein
MILDFKKKILALCLFGCAFFWVMDATLDYYYKNPSHSLLDSLFSDTPIHEFYERILVSMTLICLGIITYRYTDKIEKMHSRYSVLFGSISDAIFILESDESKASQWKISEVNQSASKMLGYNSQELLQLPISAILNSEEPTIPFLVRPILGNEYILFETELARKDGSKLVAEISVYSSGTPSHHRVMLIVRDITTKKRNQEVLQESERELQILTSQLLNAQESERQRISIGLHDELGQALMHLKFKIGTFVRECQKVSRLSSDASEELLSSVDDIIEYVRRLSRELSPSILEEIGLTSSIHYLVEEFSEHYQIHCNAIELDRIDHVFSLETQLNVFRIIQECLTNVARHAQASAVSVAGKIQGDRVLFTVEDDGKGFDVKSQLSLHGGQRGVGISAMQQRIRMLAGSFELQSVQGSGTRVSFTVPFTKGA